MTSQKHSSNNEGIVLIDILLALALSVLFVATISETSLTAHDLFYSARDRNALLDTYEAHGSDFDAMMPGETRSNSYGLSTMMHAYAHWYGNDEIETDITVGYTDASSSITFVSVRPYPYANQNEFAGRPLCSPDFALNAPVGSYEFIRTLQSNSIPTSTISITPITLPIDPFLPLTDIQVRDNIAYITADSSKASDPDLLVADISDPKNPVLESTINTGPGLSALAVAGRYVFAAADSTAAQMHVIRLDSLASPELVAKYKLPLPDASTSPTVGTSIFSDNGLVYLGTNKWDGAELAVIDASDPENPQQIGSFETGSQINSIFVQNSTALIADSDEDQLQMLDVSTPSSPRLVDSFLPSDWERQQGTAVSVFEQSINFGRDSGGYDIQTDPELFLWPADSSARSSGQSLPSLSLPPSALDIPGGIYGIVADRHYIYAATRTVNQEFSIFPRTLSTSTALYYSLPAVPQAMTCDGRHLYILAHTAPVIYEISFN